MWMNKIFLLHLYSLPSQRAITLLFVALMPREYSALDQSTSIDQSAHDLLLRPSNLNTERTQPEQLTANCWISCCGLFSFTMASRSNSYKMKASTMDKREKRILRVHRRSIDQREMRLDEVNRRRNLDNLTPVLESKNGSKHTSRTGTPSTSTLM